MTIGDQFLEILSSRASMSLGGREVDGRASVSTCLDGLCESAAIEPLDYGSGFRWWQNYMVDLGFARIDWGSKRIYVESPALTMLPTSTADTALLVGARTDSFLGDAYELASKRGLKVLTTSTACDRKTLVPPTFIPSKVLFKGEPAALAALSKDIGAQWFSVPLAYFLAKDFVLHPPEEQWQDSHSRAAASWFNPRTLRFDGMPPTAAAPLCFCRYEIPDQNGRTGSDLYMWRPEQQSPRATVMADPRTAKWLTLKQAGLRVATSPDNNRMAIPLHCPLPSVLSRALTLCTGDSARHGSFSFASGLGFDPCVSEFLVYDELHPVITTAIRNALGCESLTLDLKPSETST